MSAIEIMVVDDHPIFRHGLVRLLNEERGFHVCAEAESAREALAKAKLHRPQVAVVDIALPGANGIDLTRMLRHEYVRMTVVVLSMYKDALYAERALRAGAQAYVAKQEASEKLLNAVRDAVNGKTYVHETARRRVEHSLSGGGGQNAAVISQLSDRELQVFQLIGSGKSTRQIAQDLGLSVKTIESYRAHIKEKMGLESGYALVQSAIYWNHFEPQV